MPAYAKYHNRRTDKKNNKTCMTVLWVLLFVAIVVVIVVAACHDKSSKFATRSFEHYKIIMPPGRSTSMLDVDGAEVQPPAASSRPSAPRMGTTTAEVLEVEGTIPTQYKYNGA
jgi:hypothetical protein